MMWIEIILMIVKVLPDIIAILEKIFAKSAHQGPLARLRTEQTLKTSLLKWHQQHTLHAGGAALTASAIDRELTDELNALEASL